MYVELLKNRVPGKVNVHLIRSQKLSGQYWRKYTRFLQGLSGALLYHMLILPYFNAVNTKVNCDLQAMKCRK